MVKNISSSVPSDSEFRQVKNTINTPPHTKNKNLNLLYSYFINCDAVYPCRKFPVLRWNVLPEQRFLRKAGQFLSIWRHIP
jgi:hypothetical protein